MLPQQDPKVGFFYSLRMDLYLTKFAFLLTLTVLAINAFAIVEDQPTAVFVDVVSQDENSLQVSINVTDFTIKSVHLETGHFDLIAVQDEPTISQEGYPDLPFIARAVLVPPGHRLVPQITHTSIDTRHDLNPVIAPQATEDGFRHVLPSHEYITREGLYPAQPIKMGETAKLRGWTVQNFHFYPVQYNQTTGETIFNDQIELSFAFEPDPSFIDQNLEQDARTRISPFAARALSELVLNPPHSLQDFNYETGSYLIIYPNVNGVIDRITPLIEWRRRQGHRVIVESVQNNASYATVRNRIIAHYQSEDPIDFVALVGDADGNIGISAASQYGDLNYSLLDGNDYLPDVAVGRLTCTSLVELERVINKVVSYESNPYMQNTNWFKRGCVIAGAQVNGLSEVLLAKYVRKDLLDMGFNEVRHWYWTDNGNISGNQPFLTDAFNWGISILMYRAYNRMNNLDINVIYGMQNTDGRWPIALVSSCNTGSYVGADAYNEAFLKSRGGAIGAIGTATGNTLVQFNNMMVGGTFNGIYKKGLYHFGWGYVNGKYEMWKAYQGFDDAYRNFMEWNNYMGDPATPIWTDIPKLITVEHPEEISRGDSRFPVRVTDRDDSPLSDILVCLYKASELQLTSYTNEDGIIEFLIPPEELTDGNLLVTASKHNIRPYLGQANVGATDYFIGAFDWTISDDNEGESRGDGDGIVNPLERIELTVRFKNYGSRVPNGAISAELIPLTPYVDVNDSEVDWNNAPAVGQTVSGTFLVDIDPACPNRSVLQLAFLVSSNNGQFESMIEIETAAPKVSIDGLFYAGGGIINPGEVRYLDISLKNIGQKQLDDFTATLSVDMPAVRVLSPTVQYRSIGVNRSERVNGDLFRLSAHPFAITGIQVPFNLVIETDNGFIDETQGILTIGEKEVTDPVGPDTYGYVCFDSQDQDWEFAPDYNWIEIDPTQDRHNFRGTALNIRDNGDNDDKSAVVNLPFTFTYYGEEFDRITICTNGWAAFGDQSELLNFRNRRIGQPLAPNAMLAVWWDNLINPQGSSILYHYDQNGGRFIIEWSNVQRLVEGGGGARETFQIILYDPEFFPTITGDGRILFQYKNVTNENRRAHNDTPYCTIGISSLDGLDGIEYTYWNTYPAGARPIQSEMALLFTTETDFRTGVVMGRVTDFATGEPIPNAQIITTRSFWGETDLEGNYVINNILVGEDYSITAAVQGWNDSTLAGFNIAEGETIRVDFALLHPEFFLSTDEFAVSIVPNTQRNLNFTIHNDGNGVLNWSTEKRMADEHDFRYWDLRETIPIGEITGDARIQGVEFVDNKFYVSGASNGEPKIYVLDRDGTLLRFFHQPTQTRYGMTDLTWDGEVLWGSGEQVVYAFTTEGEEIISWNGPYINNSVFTWDPDRSYLWVGAVTNNIVAYDWEGNRIRELNRRGLRMYGLAYFPEDPDGYNIYIYHNPTGDMKVVHKMNPENGDTMFVMNLMPDESGRPQGFTINSNYDPFTWTCISVLNNNDNDMLKLWHIDVRSNWFFLEPPEGNVIPGESNDLTLVLDASGLPEITFEGELIFKHNADIGTTIVPITMEVLLGPGAEDDRELNLRTGWNLVSLNVQPDPDGIPEILQPLLDIGILQYVKDGSGRFFWPQAGFNNIPRWDVLQGYQINLTEDFILHARGEVYDQRFPIPLQYGWNMVSYLPRETTDAIVALENIVEVMQIAKDGVGRFYIPEYNYSNLGNMREGQAYQIKVTEETELVYQLGDVRVAAHSTEYLLPSHFAPPTDQSNMSVLIISDSLAFGWELGVFDQNDNLLGAGRFDQKGNCGLAVWGNEATTSVNLQFKLWDGSNEYSTTVTPVLSSPIWQKDGIFVASLNKETEIPITFGIHQAYPNPFNSTLRLNFAIENYSTTSLKVYDVQGRLVKSLLDKPMQTGRHTVVWNAEKISSGVYIVRLEQETKIAQVKVVLTK